MKKNNRIELPITITTEYTTTGDKNELALEQIEHAQLYLQSVFNFIRKAAREFLGESVSDDKNKVEEFCFDLTNFCDIGSGLAMSIWKNVSEINSGAPETLAGKISFLINDENVPVEISEAIKDALTDIQNQNKQSAISQLENSPEYIERVLRDYKNSEVGA